MKIPRFTEDKYIDAITGSMPNLINSIKYSAPVHYHDYFEFFLVTKGRAAHMVNGERQLLSDGSLVFIRPDDVHFYDYDGDSDCEFINIPYKKEIILETFRYLGSDFNSQRLLEPVLPPCIMVPSWAKDRLLSLFNRILFIQLNDKLQAKIQLKGLLIEMLTQHFSDTAINNEVKIPLWLENLMITMQKKENFTEGLTKMYRLAGRTPAHLNKVVRKYFGTTPTNYINQLRLDYSKYLLLTTQAEIIDIAFEAGFGNLSHFYHLFKERYQIPPSDFRKANRSTSGDGSRFAASTQRSNRGAMDGRHRRSE